MERGTSIWLGIAGFGLLAAVGLGLYLGQDDDRTELPAPSPRTAAPAPAGPPPADARLPDEAPTPIADDAWTLSETGLKIAEIIVGEGEEAMEGAPVVVEYTGWLAESGEVFDSSKRRAQPLLFTLGRGDAPIPGWDEAVAGMRVGGKRQAIFPPELACGQTGRAPRIPRNATIIFEFELKNTAQARIAPDEPPEYSQADLRPIGDVQVVDLIEGTGATLRQGDHIALDYSAFVQADGRRFDSSLTRTGPAKFIWGAREMLPGVETGLEGIKLGGTRLIVIPPDQGYGDNGLRGFVPPAASILFVVELLEIEAQ